MFRYLKSRTSYSNPATNDDDEEEEEDITSAALASNDDVEMPMNYCFHGWIGFKSFVAISTRDEFNSILLITRV